MQSNGSTWRMIGITAAGALLCWGASLAMLRAVAQDATPAPRESSTANDSNEAEEVQRRAVPPKTSDQEAPEFRDSADNNIRFPIDI